MSPRLSVITLTRNRLPRLLASLERLLPQLADGDEVLVLDTGSTDGTREHFARPIFRNVRFVADDGEGSWAERRNRAVALALGELVAFLDDDCLPAPGWVARGRAALVEADAVGGVARPHGIAAWPAWWHPEMGWMVGLSVPGHDGPDAGRMHYPTTANLWARAALFRQAPFQEIGGELGAAERERYASGREDAQWWRRLRIEGYRARMDPELIVEHAIDPARLDLPYLRRRAELDGRAWAWREGTPAHVGAIAYQWWREWAASLRSLAAPLTGEAIAPDWHYHQLLRRRQGEALLALAEKELWLGSSLPRLALAPRVIAAGAALARDRAKSGARAAARPWLAGRPRQGQAPRIERLAILGFGCLGDLLILQGVLRGLMAAHPRCEIYVLGPPAARVALGGVPRLNVTAVPESPRPLTRAARQWVGDWLARLDPDAIAVPYLHGAWGRTVARVGRPPRPLVGFDRDLGLTRQWPYERLGVKVYKDLARHEAQNLCGLLGAMGLPCEPRPAELAPSPAASSRIAGWLAADAPEASAERIASEAPGGFILLNPDAGTPYKEWTDAAWAALAERLLAELPGGLIINASRPHPELAARLGQASAPHATAGRVHWLDQAPLDDLIAALAASRALVTVDAGPQHLAHALGVPSLTLYGPMDERRWADLWARPTHRTLRACAADLTPEEKRGLPLNHEVSLISPDAVFRAVRELLAEADRIA